MDYIVLDDRQKILEIIPELLNQKMYLYKTWRLYLWYTEETHVIKKLSIATIDKNIVGVAIHTKTDIDGINIGVYVKDEFRRKGIGTKLVRMLEVENMGTYNKGYRSQFWKQV